MSKVITQDDLIGELIEQDRQIKRLSRSTDTYVPPASGVDVIEYAQPTASSLWVINHGLGRFPAGFQTFDEDGEEIYGDVDHNNLTTTVSFIGAFAGSANYI